MRVEVLIVLATAQKSQAYVSSRTTTFPVFNRNCATTQCRSARYLLKSTQGYGRMPDVVPVTVPHRTTTIVCGPLEDEKARIEQQLEDSGYDAAAIRRLDEIKAQLGGGGGGGGGGRGPAPPPPPASGGFQTPSDYKPFVSSRNQGGNQPPPPPPWGAPPPPPPWGGSMKHEA